MDACRSIEINLPIFFKGLIINCLWSRDHTDQNGRTILSHHIFTAENVSRFPHSHKAVKIPDLIDKVYTYNTEAKRVTPDRG